MFSVSGKWQQHGAPLVRGGSPCGLTARDGGRVDEYDRESQDVIESDDGGSESVDFDTREGSYVRARAHRRGRL